MICKICKFFSFSDADFKEGCPKCGAEDSQLRRVEG